MSITMRTIWLLTIVFFISGCSSLGVVYGPGEDEIPRPMEWTDVVESGEKVRITLEDERMIEGIVVELSADSLAVETRVQSEDTMDADSAILEESFRSTSKEIVRIGAGEDVRTIEKPQFSLGKTAALILIIAAPIVAMAVTMENPMGDLGNTGFQ